VNAWENVRDAIGLAGWQSVGGCVEEGTESLKVNES
jgi:hypothetical protein